MGDEKLTIESAAAIFDGMMYGGEPSAEMLDAMRSARLVAILGAGDDLAELTGVVRDEVGAHEGTEIYLTRRGLLDEKCPDDDCPYDFARTKLAARVIVREPGDCSFRYETDLPHATFRVLEEEATYCYGIVVCLDDCPEVPGPEALAPRPVIDVVVRHHDEESGEGSELLVGGEHVLSGSPTSAAIRFAETIARAVAKAAGADVTYREEDGSAP